LKEEIFLEMLKIGAGIPLLVPDNMEKEHFLHHGVRLLSNVDLKS
jgi:hypothetical protein